MCTPFMLSVRRVVDRPSTFCSSGPQAAAQQVLAWQRAAQALQDLAAQQQAEADSIVRRAKQVTSRQRRQHAWAHAVSTGKPA